MLLRRLFTRTRVNGFAKQAFHVLGESLPMALLVWSILGTYADASLRDTLHEHCSGTSVGLRMCVSVKPQLVG